MRQLADAAARARLVGECDDATVAARVKFWEDRDLHPVECFQSLAAEIVIDHVGNVEGALDVGTPVLVGMGDAATEALMTGFMLGAEFEAMRLFEQQFAT